MNHINTVKNTQNNDAATTLKDVVISLLDSIHSSAYISDPVSYKILYVNKALELALGEDPTGRICYKTLQDEAQPCEFCTNPYLFDESYSAPLIWTHQNKKNHLWYRCSDIAIPWDKGKKVRLEIAEELTAGNTPENKPEKYYRLLFYVLKLEDLLSGDKDPVSNILSQIPSLVSEAFSFHNDTTVKLVIHGKKFMKNGIEDPLFLKKSEVRGRKEHFGYLEAGVGTKNKTTTFSEKEKVFLEMVARRTGTYLEHRYHTERLAALETRLKLATEASGIGIWDWYTDSDEVYYSAEWKRQLGYAEDELPGRFSTWENLLHPDDYNRMHRELTDYLSNPKGIFEAVFRLKHKNGTYRWIQNRSACIKNEKGEVVRMFGSHLDISNQKQIEDKISQNNKFLNTILEVIPDFIYIYDLEEKQNVFSTHEIISLLGYSAKDIQAMGDRSMNEIAHPDDLAKITAHHNRLRSLKINRTMEIEYRMKTKDGKWKVLKCRDKPFLRKEDGRVKQIIGICRDITWEKRTEKELITISTELGEKNRELEQVLYTTSHDLRTPLLNIEGFSHIIEKSLSQMREMILDTGSLEELQQQFKTKTDPECHEAFKYIQNSIHKMDVLIRGLLTVSRTGRSALLISDIDMNTLVDEVISNISWDVREKKIQISHTHLYPCRGDRALILQLFDNLMSNAIKYLDPQRPGKIRISSRRRNGFYEYSVSDNGIGIPESEQEKIFDIFYQSDPEQEGVGIGLSIVKTIINKHRGKISVHSVPGKGTRFIVMLPAE
ncbi:MAG: PAS domain-containing protein [Chlorobi bacterium]|nr:PAS domain-containing protein [Chlorobiota bacterium]